MLGSQFNYLEPCRVGSSLLTSIVSQSINQWFLEAHFFEALLGSCIEPPKTGL